MLDAALIGSASLLGLAGVPHCALMCGGPCATLCGRRRRRLASFLLGRLLSYAVAGALLAAAVQAMTGPTGLLRPLWAWLHAALLALGLFVLLRGQAPSWLGRWGEQALGRRAPALAGLAWVAWPCGLLQSALLLAGLCNSPWSGGAAMAAFALGSSAGLVLAPALLRQLPANPATVIRLAGLGLMLASGWALGVGVWQRATGAC